MRPSTLSSLSSSKNAASVACPFHPSEASDGNFGGVYIGKTLVYRVPFFLDTSRLLNPHIAALGMTGSGKTYFMKSYIIKFRLGGNGSVFILDWNGEYDELVSFLNGEVIECKGNAGEPPMFDMNLDGVFSINLSHMKDDAERRAVAQKIVNGVIESMHGMPISERQQRVFLLDEAWRALGGGNRLGQLFREGRKYGFSIIVSTQLAKDIDNEILANAGAVLVFRLQSSDDQSTLIGSGMIPSDLKGHLANLNIGNCILRLAYKEHEGHGCSNIIIRKIDGISTSVYSIKGGKMQIKISSGRFLDVTGMLIKDGALKSKLINYIEANERSLDLKGLIAFLAKNGLCRADIVVYLRLLGFDDLTIVRSYESVKKVAIEA